MKITILVHKISLTSAAGAALLVLKDIKHEIWNDLNLQLDDCENVWTEIDTTKNKKKIIVAAVYIHQSSNLNDFQISLKSKLEQLKITVYGVRGDIGINLLTEIHM